MGKAEEMTKDYTGRKLKVGQMVDICLIGMYRGKVVEIREAPIVLSPKQQLPPHAVVQVVMTPSIQQDGVVSIYIIEEPDPKDPLVLAAAEGNSSIVS